MRKHLPERAQEFVSLFSGNPEWVLGEVNQAILGNTSLQYQDVLRMMRGSSPHVRVFIALAEAWGLHANEARELFSSLPPDQQARLNSSISTAIAGELRALEAERTRRTTPA